MLTEEVEKLLGRFHFYPITEISVKKFVIKKTKVLISKLNKIYREIHENRKWWLRQLKSSTPYILWNNTQLLRF